VKDKILGGPSSVGSLSRVNIPKPKTQRCTLTELRIGLGESSENRVPPEPFTNASPDETAEKNREQRVRDLRPLQTRGTVEKETYRIYQGGGRTEPNSQKQTGRGSKRRKGRGGARNTKRPKGLADALVAEAVKKALGGARKERPGRGGILRQRRGNGAENVTLCQVG